MPENIKPMPTFDQLRTLLVIVETGSFTRAAERLFVTQPAITQRIKQLERVIGAPIFD